MPFPENHLSCTCTFSRTELLSMVKKHSHLIGWTVVDAEDDASDVGMDDKFWHEMLDLFFVRGRVSKRREEDDLVFFVNNMVPFSPVDFDPPLILSLILGCCCVQNETHGSMVLGVDAEIAWFWVQ